MDPFSITVGCISLLDAASHAIVQIKNLTKSFLDAPSEMTVISGHLKQLTRILEPWRGSSCRLEPNATLSYDYYEANEKDNHIKDEINCCLEVLEELGSLLDRCRDSRIKWAVKRKAEAQRIEKLLKDHIKQLTLALNLDVSVVARDIKMDTDMILDSQIRIEARLDRLTYEVSRLHGSQSAGELSLECTESLQWRDSPEPGSPSTGTSVPATESVQDSIYGETWTASESSPITDSSTVIQAQEAQSLPFPDETISNEKSMFSTFWCSWPSFQYNNPWCLPQTSIKEASCETFTSWLQPSAVGDGVFAPSPSLSSPIRSQQKADSASQIIREQFKCRTWALAGKSSVGSKPPAVRLDENRKNTTQIAESSKQRLRLKASMASQG